MSDSGSEGSPLDRFRKRFDADLESGDVRSLEEYLQLFPGDATGIAIEYLHHVETGESITTRREPPALPAPTSGPDGLGPYRLVRELGRGGQAIVYLAEDRRLHRSVALKVLTGMGGLSGESLARLKREAEIASRLDHPNLCTVFEAGIDGGRPYIAMKFVPGTTLAAMLKIRSTSRSPITTEAAFATAVDGDRPSRSTEAVEAEAEAEAEGPTSGATPRTPAEISVVLRMIETVARAVHVAHEAGIIHRDLKPGNVMVTPEGEPVVLDFGLARDESDASLTRTGDFIGTPAYMAPEQLTAHRIRPDRRTDVYALGVCLYECVTLQRPFSGATRESLYQAILTKEPQAPVRLNRGISRDLQVVIRTAMDKDPDRRYESALALAEDLRRLREHAPIQARPAGPLRRLASWSRRNPALATALGLLLAVLAGSAIVLGVKNADLARQRDLARSLGDAERRQRLRVTELADAQLLLQLEDRARTELWPRRPETLPAFDAWLGTAAELEQRRPGHEAALLALRRQALAPGEEDRPRDLALLRELRPEPFVELDRSRERLKRARARRRQDAEVPGLQERVQELEATIEDLESRPELRTDRAWRLDLAASDPEAAARLEWRFADRDLADRHRRLTRLVRDLAALPGLITRVREHRSFAASVVVRSEGEDGSAWTECLARLRRDPRFSAAAARMGPVVPLRPLGPNPEGYWEFWHVGTGRRPERQAGNARISEGSGLVMVLLPGGRTRMGAQRDPAGGPHHDPLADPREGPVNEVWLAPFFVSKFEMTQDQWLRFTGRNPSTFGPAASSALQALSLLHPVESLSWEELVRELPKLGLRLPTESQWEYACRAGTVTPWPTGADRESLQGRTNLADAAARRGRATWESIQDWLDDGFLYHAPVGSFPPNGFGLHDLLGNVAEWCQDRYADGYLAPARPGDGLREPEHPSPYRVFRGGSFIRSHENARSAHRGKYYPDQATQHFGVRPVLVPDW